MGWMTSWAGWEVEEEGPFLFEWPLPGGRGITAVPEGGYRPWLSASWYRAACLASASFFPTTNLGSGRSLTGWKGKKIFTKFGNQISLKGTEIVAIVSALSLRSEVSIQLMKSADGIIACKEKDGCKAGITRELISGTTPSWKRSVLICWKSEVKFALFYTKIWFNFWCYCTKI